MFSYPSVHTSSVTSLRPSYLLWEGVLDRDPTCSSFETTTVPGDFIFSFDFSGVRGGRSGGFDLGFCVDLTSRLEQYASVLATVRDTATGQFYGYFRSCEADNSESRVRTLFAFASSASDPHLRLHKVHLDGVAVRPVPPRGKISHELLDSYLRYVFGEDWFEFAGELVRREGEGEDGDQEAKMFVYFGYHEELSAGRPNLRVLRDSLSVAKAVTTLSAAYLIVGQDLTYSDDDDSEDGSDDDSVDEDGGEYEV